MSRSRWRALISRLELEDRPQAVIDIITMGKSLAMLERYPGPCGKKSRVSSDSFSAPIPHAYPRTLVFPISTLDLLVYVFLDLALKNSRPCWLVEPSSL
jgi:hypothetical protein